MPRLALVALLFAPLVAPAAEVDFTPVEKTIETVRKELNVPGAAVVVVHQDQVVFLQGFGVREQGKPENVTPDTVFPIASCSKAFTATLLAQLVEEGKLSWDGKVREYLECFRLTDELADREVRLRDLLCHRTGMPRHDLLWSARKSDTVELIRRWTRAQPSSSFRSTWEYANVPFTAAGVIVGLADKSNWATSVENRLFKPLGMKASSGTWKAGCDSPDHATPHYHAADGTIRAVPWDDIDATSGAGSVNSTARDMAQWLRFQLAGGQLGDQRILAEESLKETHRPQMIVKMDDISAPYFPETTTKLLSYGLGWFVSDYRGYRCLSHGGTLSGSRAHCFLLPEKKLGIFVVCNLRPTYFPETVCRIIADRFLDAPTEDWLAFARKNTAAIDEKFQAEVKKRAEQRQKDTKPTLPLKDYAGTYQEQAYGPAEVRVEGENLHVRWGLLEFRLEHYHHDRFTAVLINPASHQKMADRTTYEAIFSLNPNHEAVGMTLFGQGFAKAPAAKSAGWFTSP